MHRETNRARACRSGQPSRGTVPACAVLFSVLVLLAPPTPAQDLTTFVSAPDGVRLATDVFLPVTGGSWPVVLIRTPYGKDEMADFCRASALVGFACVVQDTRGRFDSGGEDTVFRDDGPDGRATVDWIAGQTWCDGHVGTFGGSALGITQYQMAPGAPPALKCQVVGAATPDLYHHAMLQGGTLRDALIHTWLDGQGSLSFLDFILGHRLWGPWWADSTPILHPGAVEVPTLHVGGWYDVFLQGSLDAFTAWQDAGGDGARGHQYLVVGPWTHASFTSNLTGQLLYPANAVYDLTGPTYSFFDHWLKGRDAGVEAWPAVHIYLMGAVGEEDAPGNRWLDLRAWPPVLPHRKLYLTAAGALVGSIPPAGAVRLVSDPADPVPTLGGANLFPDLEVNGRPMGAGPYDQRSIEQREDVLAFSTEVLRSPVTVIGRLSARIWVLPDTPDLDIAVRLTDVYPDGRSMLVTDGIARARARCGDDRECFLIPGVPAEVVVDLWSTAIVFAAGHRIRIDISGSNSPRFEVNPNDGGDLNQPGPGVIGHPDLLVGPDHPSHLDLPVVPAPRRASRRAVPHR